jgi:hypothetical protein
MALLSRIPRFPILGILEIGGIDDEEPKSGTLRKGRGRNGGVARTGCFHSCKIVSRKQLAKDDLRRAALHTLNVEKTHDNQNGEVVR